MCLSILIFLLNVLSSVEFQISHPMQQRLTRIFVLMRIGCKRVMPPIVISCKVAI